MVFDEKNSVLSRGASGSKACRTHSMLSGRAFCFCSPESESSWSVWPSSVEMDLGCLCGKESRLSMITSRCCNTALISCASIVLDLRNSIVLCTTTS